MKGFGWRLCALVSVWQLVAAPASADAGFVSDVVVSPTEEGAEVRLIFNCPSHYLSHAPERRGRDVVIHLEIVELCAGIDPALLAPETKRVRGGELASLDEIEFEPEGPGGTQLGLHFSREVQFRVLPQIELHELIVAVSATSTATSPAAPPALAQSQNTGGYAINLRSSTTPFDRRELAPLITNDAYTVYENRTVIQGRTWYRLRIGFFDTESAAKTAADSFRAAYPSLWITSATYEEVQVAKAEPWLDDRAAAPTRVAESTPAPADAANAPDALDDAAAGSGEQNESDPGGDRSSKLEEGRRALAAGDYSKAVQLFTKILQQGGDEIARTAQELLGVARERNGQLAHAKAAYEEYLRLYPDGEGASRVRQRLAVLMAAGSPKAAGGEAPNGARTAATGSSPDRWRMDTSLWQYYRRQISQVNDTPDLLTQSALLSNVDVSLRRTGELTDLQSRLALGYWYDFLGQEGPGNELNLYNAYVEADGHQGRWRTRLGRQSRGVAGVLGRYDGISFSYQAADRITLNAVGGYPVYSSRDPFDRTRVFQGLSVDFDKIGGAWDISAFYNQQHTAGILDRQAIGAETRYFDESRGLYTLIDYDLSYSTLNSIYVVGNWRMPSRLTVNATVNRARSPFLTTSNALIGQPLTSIDALLAFETEEQIRQLALDRTATSTTYSFGVSRPLLQKLELDLDVTSTAYSSTVASGGVDAFPASDYKYYSASLLAQSLLKEGDMGIFTVRVGDTTSYHVTSFSLDMRYPFGGLRVNPRIRVDRRTALADGSSEWIYTPMLRMQYQWRRHYYFEFEAGLYLSDRALDGTSDQFRTTFFNLGYRYAF